MIFNDIGRAIAQLGDPRFRRVLWLGLGLTLVLLVAATAAVVWLIGWATPDTLSLPFVGRITWLGDVLGWGGLALMLLLSVFLMIPVASAISSLFLDQVAQAVEDRHYPALPAPPPLPLSEALRDTVSFLGILILANIAALVLYLMLPFLIPFIFYGLNGYLLGREYFQLAAMRREGRSAARDMLRRNRARIWAAGCLMAVPLSVPVLNLLVPIVGAAAFTHLYHRLSNRRPAPA